MVVVDNGSSDDTVAALSRSGEQATVVALGRNAGAAGRNVGVSVARTPYVAFADDDSSWRPGALGTAVDALERHPHVALVTARVLVGDRSEMDPTGLRMAADPLKPLVRVPGPEVLGFIACAAVVRRDAFLAVGGFDERYGVGGEEGALAIELATNGWTLAYVPDVVALHWPSSPRRDPTARRRAVIRNDLWLSWSRRRLPAALRTTARWLCLALRDPAARAGALDAMGNAAAVLRTRRCVDHSLERRLRLLD